MHPVLFTWHLPQWLLNTFGFLPAEISPKTYGTLIACGILAAWFYGTYEAKKFGVRKDTITDMFLWLILAGFVGGKFFFYLEDPSFYFSNGHWLKNMGNGFVFYGSMLFAFPTLWIFFKNRKIPPLKMIDVIAIGGAIVHAFGRMGCFMAGCCHGVPTDSWLGVTFTDPLCNARPLDTPLHPTQLYSVFMLLIILSVLFYIKKHRRFDGQLFPVYLMMYAVGRSVIEEFRGDEARGFIMDGWLSHSQFISIFIFLGAAAFYYYLSRKAKQANGAKADRDKAKWQTHQP
ncbi:prolipoprotein diacylglyceryl transferase [bacterium]|nr:prolipoprotein diacylglyceryl transferase [bacterium]